MKLQIGNWVHLKDKGYYQIDSGHDIDEILGNEEGYCTGIPLTEELILKTETWDYSPNKKYLYLLIDGDVSLSFRIDTGRVILNGKILDIKYLHELQNLYPFIAEEELIINL